MILNKENTFTENNRFLVYSDQLNATRKQILGETEEMISRSAIQTFEDEGETITANDASYLASLTVDGKAVQDGTPTPDSPVDVQVVQSINLFDANGSYAISSQSMQGAKTISDYGEIRAVDTSLDTRTASYSASDFKFRLPAGTYTITVFVDNAITSASRMFRLYDSDNTIIYQEIANLANVGVYNRTLAFNNEKDLGFVTKLYDGAIRVQIESGSTATPYIPYGSIGLKVNDTITPIDLQGNVLASLPDGTKDVLTVDSAGHVVIDKCVGYTAQATTDGIVATVGVDAISSTGDLSDNADVYYKLATASIIDAGYITMPAIPDGAEISITAQVTPTIAAKWWRGNQSDMAAALSAVSSDLGNIQSKIDALDARVTALESANSKNLLIEKLEDSKETTEDEISEEPEELEEPEEAEELEEQEQMPLDDEE